MVFREKYDSWKKLYQSRSIYCTADRRPFYDVAAKYLPSGESGVVVDVGSGALEWVLQ